MSTPARESRFGFSEKAITDLTALPTVIFATTFFILVWSWIKSFVAKHGIIAGARTVNNWKSRLYSIFSLGLAIMIARSVLLGEEGDRIGEVSRYTYHYSKFFEYVDVFFLVASGHAIGKHLAFHHITTPFLTYFRVLRASDWQVFAFLNSVHHFLMYGYYGGVTFVRPALFYTQCLQLGGGIALDAFYFFQHGTKDTDEATGRAVSLMLLLRYAQLYSEEMKAGKLETAGPVKVEDKKKK